MGSENLSPFDKLRMENGEDFIPDFSGKIWLTMLIEYDSKGNAKVLRTFSKPAKDSNVKQKKKQKQQKPKEEKIEFKKSKSSSELF